MYCIIKLFSTRQYFLKNFNFLLHYVDMDAFEFESDTFEALNHGSDERINL